VQKAVVLTEDQRKKTRPEGVEWGLDSYFQTNGNWNWDVGNRIVTFKSSLDVLPLCGMQIPGEMQNPPGDPETGLWQCRMYLTHETDKTGSLLDGSAADSSQGWSEAAREEAPAGGSESLADKGFCDFTYEKAGDAKDLVDQQMFPWRKISSSKAGGKRTGVTTLGFRLVQARCRVHRSGLPPADAQNGRREVNDQTRLYAQNGGYNAVDDDGRVCSDLQGKHLLRFTAQNNLVAVDAGHVLASSLGGLGGVFANIFPQDSTENQIGAWKRFEKGVRSCLTSTNTIVADAGEEDEEYDAVLHLAVDFIYHQLGKVSETFSDSSVSGLYKPIRIAYTVAWPAGITNALKKASQQFLGLTEEERDHGERNGFCDRFWGLLEKKHKNAAELTKHERELIHAMLGYCVPTERGPFRDDGVANARWFQAVDAGPDRPTGLDAKYWPLLVKEVMSMPFVDFETFKGSRFSDGPFENWKAEVFKDNKEVKSQACPLLFAVREDIERADTNEYKSSLKYVGGATSMKGTASSEDEVYANVLGRLARTVYFDNPCSCKASSSDRTQKGSHNSWFFRTAYAPFVRVYALPQILPPPDPLSFNDPTKQPAVEEQLKDLFDKMFLFYGPTKDSSLSFSFRDVSLAKAGQTCGHPVKLPCAFEWWNEVELDDGKKRKHINSAPRRDPNFGWWPEATQNIPWPGHGAWPAPADIKMRPLVVDDALGAIGYGKEDASKWGFGASLPCIVASSEWRVKTTPAKVKKGSGPFLGRGEINRDEIAQIA